ncbi:uncharacterized protein LOC104886884 [Beta vulgaris subsp. vulgaris]|uniref:uncharacterized protein LOC104886884 n=1 Tax=Beta vulgaris subsp. vulgaris TaxID=3555 RepID=UPI00053F52CF|nr:uncharacterized protein LOC104886884 [Beta vulgaris subsp. vulgaris]
MQKSKVDQQLGKFLAMVKNLEVTVHYTDLISLVPVYVKFLKDMIIKKKDFGGIDRVSLIEECNVVLQNKISPKLKDPGSFFISCHVGALFIDNALCGLGASVSVMTLSILLDMEEDSQIPIILGRPFLCTAGAVIDVKSGSLTLSVGDDTVTSKLSNALKSPMLENTCCRIDVIEEIARYDAPRALLDDPLEAILTFGASKGEGDDEATTFLHDLDDFNTNEAEGFEVMQTTCSTSKPQVKKVELKPLPSYLRYAFLDDTLVE